MPLAAAHAAEVLGPVEPRQRMAALVVLRSPFAWLSSVRRAPYDLRPCVRRADAYGRPAPRLAWLTEPCELDAATAWSRAFQKLVPLRTSFPSLAEMWNTYTRDYLELLPQLGFATTTVVRFEDLAQEPGATLARVQDELLGALYEPFDPARVQLVTQPLKENTHGREHVLQALAARSYLAEWSPEERLAVCARLDRVLLERFAYDDDCAGFFPEVEGTTDGPTRELLRA